MLNEGTKMNFRTIKGIKELVVINSSPIELENGQKFRLNNIPYKLQKTWRTGPCQDVTFRNGQFHFDNGTVVDLKDMPDHLSVSHQPCSRDYPTSKPAAITATMLVCPVFLAELYKLVFK